eukprot:SAG31_NODE_1231_length_9212_cov_2.857566_8_plen_72_part_00
MIRTRFDANVVAILRLKCGGARREIVDQLWIPSDLSEGKWLLGWRWDAEESSQVWASCSDVTIKKAVSTSS